MIGYSYRNVCPFFFLKDKKGKKVSGDLSCDLWLWLVCNRQAQWTHPGSLSWDKNGNFFDPGNIYLLFFFPSLFLSSFFPPFFLTCLINYLRQTLALYLWGGWGRTIILFSILWNSRYFFGDLWDTHFFLSSQNSIWEAAFTTHQNSYEKVLLVPFLQTSLGQIDVGMCAFPNLLGWI